MQFTAEHTGERLDTFLARIAPEYSRSYWQKRCETGDVAVNDRPAKASLKLQTGDHITVQLPNTPNISSGSLPLLYEDDDVMVINKPAGVLTHAKGTELEEFTVAAFVRPHTTDSTDTNRPGIVHRLDRGTSGVMIIAKHPEAKRWLQAQFAQRKVKKTYVALVEGHLEPREAIVQLPVERNPKKPQTFRVGANGKPAETRYRVDASYQHYDLVHLQPQTGRTHQLRVHLRHLGHAIVGDPVYGTANKKLGRMFLHAKSLELTLPSRVRRVFTAPLPDELTSFLTRLQ